MWGSTQLLVPIYFHSISLSVVWKALGTNISLVTNILEKRISYKKLEGE